MTKLIYTLTKTIKESVDGGRTETLYTYTSGERVIRFHAHPTLSFCYVPVELVGVTKTDFDRFVIAWMARGMRQHQLGGWDNAISEVVA
jgi:hypothetical protein